MLDQRGRIAFATIAVAGLVMAIAAAVIAGRLAAISIVVGAALALGNLFALALVMRAVLRPGGAGLWGILSGIKLIVLFGAVYALLRWEVIALGPLAIGYAALPLGIAISAFVSDKAART